MSNLLVFSWRAKAWHRHRLPVHSNFRIKERMERRVQFCIQYWKSLSKPGSLSVGLSVWAVLVSISFWWKRTKGVRYLCSPDAWIGWNWTEFWIHSIQPFFPYENRNRIEKLKVLWLGYNLCPEWNQISRSFMNFLIEVRRYVRLGNWHVPNWTLLRKSSLRKCGIRTVRIPRKRKALALLSWLTLGQRSWACI
jgi:hypothetical protein